MSKTERDALHQAFMAVYRDLMARNLCEFDDDTAERLFGDFLADMRQGFPSLFDHWSRRLVS